MIVKSAYAGVIVTSLTAGLVLFFGSFAGAQQTPWAYPPLEDSISIRDGRSKQEYSWSELIDQLKAADLVFLGESHDDDTTHQLQLGVYEALLAAREQNVVLAMEMFERDVQPVLDQYLAGTITEAEFLKQSHPWGNYYEAYRPLVEKAKAVGKPVIAANFPRALRMKLMQSGAKSLDNLSKDPALTPEQLFPNSDLYWKRADNATRSHSMFMTVETDPQSRLISTQSLWDNSMGEACVKALNKYPGHQVVHLNGGFHTEYWDGTAAQVRLRKPDANIKTIAIRASGNPQTAKLVGEPVADFVVFVEERAKNLNEDSWSVVVDQENRYYFHQPSWASVDRPAPLLIWLSDDGLSSEDNLAYWKSAIGEQVAIAVIEPIHRQQEMDLSLSGRWFWLDRFPHDVGAAQQTVEMAWKYLLNRFPIDPERVCVAGEGTGATIVAASSLLTSSMEVQSLAFRPRQFSKIKDFPLPLLEDWGKDPAPKRSLTVLTEDADRKWWNDELAEYQRVGIQVSAKAVDSNPWTRVASRQSEILQALGLKVEAPQDPKSKRKALIAQIGSPKELHWLQRLAERLTDDKTQVAVLRADEKQALEDVEQVDFNIGLDQVQAGALPMCPGSFGGTTVVVLNQSQVENLEEWLELETNDRLTARSRFNRTRIAVAQGVSLAEGHSHLFLPSVLEKLLGENRKNVLIVPATFCASAEQMLELSRQAGTLEDRMTLHWLPGLGGEE